MLCVVDVLVRVYLCMFVLPYFFNFFLEVVAFICT